MRRLIILAAGRGMRLGRITDSRPKCMVPLFGKPILEWQIECARAVGVEEIIVVRGYCGEQIQLPGLTYVDNPRFESTNMVYSLWCAREHFGNEFLVSYGDILYNVDVLRAMYETKYEIAVAVDRQWLPYWSQRFDDVLSDAESLRLNKDGCITNIGQKVHSLEEIQGQYIGLVGFRGQAVETVKSVLKAEEDAHSIGTAKLSPLRNFTQLYMTDVLQGLIDLGYSVHPVFIDGDWLEVDTIKDLNLIDRLIRQEGQRLVIKR